MIFGNFSWQLFFALLYFGSTSFQGHAACAQRCQIDAAFFSGTSGDVCQTINSGPLSDAQIVKGIWVNSVLSQLNFTRTDLNGALFSYSHLSQISFDEASLFRANFDRTRLVGVELDDVDLRGATFIGAYIESSDFSGADLRGTDFGRAQVDWATRFTSSIFDHTTYLPFSRTEARRKGMIFVRAATPTVAHPSTPSCQRVGSRSET